MSARTGSSDRRIPARAGGASAPARAMPRTRNRIVDFFELIFASKTATVGLCIVLFWVLIAILAPLDPRDTPV